MPNKISLVVSAKNTASGVLAKVRRDSDDLGKSALGTSSKLGMLGSGLVSMGKVAVIGLAALAAGAAVGSKAVFGLSARLEQMAAKVQTVFGKQEAGNVKAWADTVSSRMGVTSAAAQGLAADFGDLLIPMKFTRQQAREMSTDVVGLSGALSEWTGGTRSAAEVSHILAKAMLGERESLKELGISILDADVKARLLTKGQQALTGSALEQAKAVASMELIFEKSKDAQDAYAKSGDGLLGKQAQLNAKLSQLGENIATAVTPVFHTLTAFLVDKVVPAAESVIGKVQKWVKENQPLVNQITAFIGGALKSFVTAIGNVIGWIGQLITKITANRDAMNFLRAAADFLSTAFRIVSTVVGTVVGAIGGFLDKLTKNKAVVSAFRAVVDGLASAFRFVRDVIGFVVGKIQTLIAWVKTAITWIGKLGDKIAASLSNIGNAGNIYSNLYGGGKAAGGPVKAGTTYMVGEQGPELFRPSGSGSIVPNDRLGANGGGGVTINVGFQSLVPASAGQMQAAARAFVPELVNEMRRQKVLA